MTKDPNILLSMVNCKLRDCCKDLDDLSDKLDMSVEEIVSILKNMTLCGLPVPTRLKLFIQKFLDDMTEELPEEVVEELHKEDVQQLEGE